MWGASEEPPGTVAESVPDPEPESTVSSEETKSQLETFKEIMNRNKQSMKKKEQEAQEYAKKLSKFKSRAKYSRKSKNGAASSGEADAKPSSETSSVEEIAGEDVSLAKAKSSLLQKKLAEDREMFERRSKEITESKRAVEERVEAIKQQLDEKTTAVLESVLYQSSVNQSTITSSYLAHQEKDMKITELNNRVLELEAMILDLQENLKEKDSVIESKMQAVTLMSANLSKKGKTTLDTLEDTKDEMRSMQENFVLIEQSLKNKNTNLLKQLEERNGMIATLEDNIQKLEGRLSAQKEAETASADFSRSTMDTLLETKDAMKSMQENFALVETSLKSKNDHLLQQLEDRELRLAEAQAKILQLESGAGFTRPPQLEDLEYKILKLEESNRELQNEKYELQKTVAELQNKLLTNEPIYVEGIVLEKSNRIAELENLVDELRKSNQLLEEESREELQNQVAELTTKNDDLVTKVSEMEQKVNELEIRRSGNAGEAVVPKEDDKDKEIAKLMKELDELNKSMIKLKAQHKSQMKNLRKQLDNFRKVSDTNAELIRLGNQVALLEEEKGNLQLSLVDFDELKASSGDLNTQMADLENKITAQTREIETHIEAIAQLENQKLDLTQELIIAKQEISNLEAENAESENLRVTAEMKIVELEEQLETLNKSQLKNKQDSESTDHLESLQKQVNVLMQENADLVQKLSKLEEKSSSNTDSTESFETIHETDKSELLKKIESLVQKNVDLENKLSKLNVDSTDSFENIHDIDKADLIKRIDLLTRENGDLIMKLSRYEEKGSSDTGSTESFEKIPEHVETVSKLELLTRENNELVIKTTKLEEKLNELTEQIAELKKENQELTVEKNELKEKELALRKEVETSTLHDKEQTRSLENQLEEYNVLITKQKEVVEDLKLKLADKEEELKLKSAQMFDIESQNNDLSSLQQELRDTYSLIEEWKYRYATLEDNVRLLEEEKISIKENLISLLNDNARLNVQLEEQGMTLESEKSNAEKLKDLLEMKSQELESVSILKDQEILNLNEIIAANDKEIEYKKQELEKLKIEIDQLHEELMEQKNESRQNKDLNLALKEEINKLNIKDEEREAFLKKATEEYDELLQDLTNKNAAYNLLQMQMDEINKENKDVKKQIESLNLRNEEQRILIEDLENRLHDLQGMLDNNNLYINELKNELVKNQEIIERMNTKFVEDTDNYNRKLAEVLVELQDKVSENETLVAKLKDTETLISQDQFNTIKADLESKVSEMEKDIEAKVDKMKKFAIKLKKKTLECEKLEQKILDFEGQLMTEKEEKEVLNLKIQESTILLQERDNKIIELEEQLKNYAETLSRLNQQLTESQKKLEDVLQRIHSVGEENIEGLINRLNVQQDEYLKVKENVRELENQVQVLETEVANQVTNIQTLQSNNNLLVLQNQEISEDLKNAQALLEERRILLEQMESDREFQRTQKEETKTMDEPSRQQCQHCEGYQARVSEIEAKLQEKDAEIENLDNELATSIVNFVQMQDLRFNQGGQGDNTQEAYNELMVQYNSLRTVNEEMKKQLDSAVAENKELMEKISSLQQLNETLQDTLNRPDTLLTDELESLKIDLAEKVRMKEQYEEKIAALNEEIVNLKKAEQSENVEKNESNEPPMFDAFKAFTGPDYQSIIDKLQNQIDERDNQCSKLSAELERLSNQLVEERSLAQQTQTRFSDEILQLQSQLSTVNSNLSTELERHLSPLCGVEHEEIAVLKETISEKNKELDYLSGELIKLKEELNQALEAKSELIIRSENDKVTFETRLRELLSEKEDLSCKLNDLYNQQVSLNEEIEASRTTISDMKLKEEQANEIIENKHQLITTLQAEKEELSGELERHREDIVNVKARLQEVEDNLNEVKMQKVNLEENVVKLKQSVEEREQELVQKSENVGEVIAKEELEAEGWNEENVEKLELEEGWNWNAEQVPESSEGKSVNLESELLSKITFLECEIKNLERDKEMLLEKNTALQAKCDKAVKKLMQKIKQEKLMQMHQQKSSSSLCDLDQTMVEELKSQIATLEKSLQEAEEKRKEILLEKENLMKRVDVLTAGNERYMEIMERQDMDIEVYKIRNKELSAKIEAMESQLQFVPPVVVETQSPVPEAQISKREQQFSSESTPSLCEIEKHQEQISELKENIEALAAENEQLQQFLNEQKDTKLELESRLASECTLKTEDLNRQFAELKANNDKLKEEYDLLRRQYEQSLMDANDQVQVIRRNNELLKQELDEKILRHSVDLNTMEDDMNRKMEVMKDELQKILNEKEALVQKLNDMANIEAKFSSASTSLMDVSELLNLRVQEVASLKEELKRQCDERLVMERSLHETNEKLLIDLNEKQQRLDECMAIIFEKDSLLYQEGEEIKQLTNKLKELEYSKQQHLAELSDKNADIERHVEELKRLKEIVNEKESIYSACQADSVSKEIAISEQQSRVSQCELELKKFAEEVERYSAEVHRLKDLLYEEATRRGTLIEESLKIKVDLAEKALTLEKCSTDHDKCLESMEKDAKELNRLNDIIQRDQIEIERLSSVMQSESMNFNTLINHLTLKDQQISEAKEALAEKEELINNINEQLAAKQSEIDKLVELNKKESDPLDTIPVFTMIGGDDDVEKLKSELIAKQVEVDNLTYALNKNTYPRILEELQETINKLYNDKAQLEMALANCEEEREKLKEQMNAHIVEIQNKEATKHELYEKRLNNNQEEIVRLQNELHLKEQEINELKYIIGEKDAKLQASMETLPEDLELRQTIEILNSQLFAKHQEGESLVVTINSLRNELEAAKHHERLSEEYKAALELLQSEKEQSAQEFQEKIAKLMKDKEEEIINIVNIKETEKNSILEVIQTKDKEIESLHKQINECHEQMHELDKELAHARNDLAEKERRLAELSITKDTEIHTLNMLIHERDVRIEELHALSEEENKQLTELKSILAEKEHEQDMLKRQLVDKLVQNVPKGQLPDDQSQSAETEGSGSREADVTYNELDMALYMLHQRDVRCEELTQELMQLLEERDTLQLRLSNAIRVNEELRKIADAAHKEPEASASEPLVEDPSSAESDGPVEMAREAIHTPISLNEDREELVKKLSQLHNVGHAKDVRLKDERELRHNQQMSLLAHKEVLSSLPPEAAARLVNANYTLSRDVQSQSSVLLNWLWGKSTPKVVHM